MSGQRGDVIRPLRRIGPGQWQSRGGRWSFLQHHSDPHPRRWFVFEGDDEDPYFFAGFGSLREAIAAVEREATL